MAKNDRRRFVPEPESVWLGQGEKTIEYKVVPVAWTALFQLKDELRTLLSDMTGLWNAEILQVVREIAGETDDAQTSETLQKLLVNDGVWDMVDKLLEKPEIFFKIAIPDLDASLFDPSIPNGATIPQVWATFEVIAEVNKLDFAKNLIGGRTSPQAKS